MEGRLWRENVNTVNPAVLKGECIILLIIEGLSPTVNTFRMKLDKFTVGANNTRQKPNYRCEGGHFGGKKMTSVWARVASGHSQQLKQQQTDNKNTTKQHNTTFLQFRTFKKETQTGQEFGL